MANGLPEAVEVPKDRAVAMFRQAMELSWNLGVHGVSDLCCVATAIAQNLNVWRGTDVAPGLMPSRFKIIENPEGQVVSVMPTEDKVVQCVLPETAEIGATDTHFRLNFESLAMGIRTIIDNPPEWTNVHRANAKRARPPVQVLSTGRAGTLSLAHLVAKTEHYQPFHAYWWNVSLMTRMHFLAALCDRRVPMESAGDAWCHTRAAEWLGSKRAVMINHLDTIFSPLTATIHPDAQFIYLMRDAEPCFKSFWLKNQETTQLCDFNYSTKDGKVLLSYDTDPINTLAFHFASTDLFATAMKGVLGNRMHFIDADKLFAGDQEEIAMLRGLVCHDLSQEDVTKHYGKRINEKAHKVDPEREKGLESAYKKFSKKYKGLLNDSLPKMSLPEYKARSALQ